MSYKTEFSVENRNCSLPYALRRVAKNKWVILNRLYKPIGIDDHKLMVKYEDYSIKINGFKLRDTVRFSWCGQPACKKNEYTVWLYNDGCIPDRTKENAEAYRRKLNDLRKLGVFE